LGGDVREWAGVPAAELRPKIEVFAEALDQLGRLEMSKRWGEQTFASAQE